MNISGMRPYEGFYEYNSIKAVALRSQQIAAVQNASGDEELSGGSQPQGQTQTKRPQTYNAFDYAKEYQPDETYELKGADSDLAGWICRKQFPIWKRIRCCSSISILWERRIPK